MTTALQTAGAAAPAREPESPKRFFKILRARALDHHKAFTRSLSRTGLLVRRVVRRAHHAHVWGLYLKRGSVMPGLEAESVRSAVCAVVKESGAKLPPREVDVLTKGERTNAGLAAARARGRLGGRRPISPDDPRVQTARTLHADKRMPVGESARPFGFHGQPFIGIWRGTKVRTTADDHKALGPGAA